MKSQSEQLCICTLVIYISLGLNLSNIIKMCLCYSNEEFLQVVVHVLLLWGVIICRVEEKNFSFVCPISSSTVLSVPVLFVQPHHGDPVCCVCVCAHVRVCAWLSVSSAGCVSGCEFPFPVSSPGTPPFPDDLCVVFVVELDKGPYGLGMGLIDGLVSSEMLWCPFRCFFFCLIWLICD